MLAIHDHTIMVDWNSWQYLSTPPQEWRQEILSNPTKRASKSQATIWQKGRADEFGRVTYSTPFTVACTFDDGGKTMLRDSNGVEFVPESMIWYDFDGLTAKPEEGDYIVRGEFTDLNPVSGSRVIRAVKLQDCGLLNQNDDLLVVT